MYKWFLVTRYLISRAIPLAALVVVACSVALLIVIVSVLEGFRGEHKRKIRGTGSDITVASKLYIDLKDPLDVARVVKEVPGVTSAVPYVETMVLYRPSGPAGNSAALETRFLKAFDIEAEFEAGGFADYIRAARMERLSLFRSVPEDPRELFTDEWVRDGLWRAIGRRKPGMFPDEGPYPRPIVVGLESLLRDYLLPGSLISLTAYSPTTFTPVTQEFIVAGYFKTGIYELDVNGILMGLDVADGFLSLSAGARPVASGVRVSVAPEVRGERELAEVSESIRTALDENDIFFARTRTWREEKAQLLRALKIEKGLTSLILGISVLFGGFMIFIILTVQVVEKTRDIGVLQAMGVTRWGSAGIFLRMGLVLCVSGTVLGAVYGIGFAYFVNTIQRWIWLLTGTEVFPLTMFYMDRIPVEFKLLDIVLIIVPTVLIGLAASFLPAYRAVQKQPIDAIRGQ